MDFVLGLARKSDWPKRATGISPTPRRRAGGPGSRHGASRTSSTRRARAGAAVGASSARPNGRRAKPTRFIVTSLGRDEDEASLSLREDLLRARRHGEPRRIGLQHTPFAKASCGSIRLAFLKFGTVTTTSLRRIKIAMASRCPYQHDLRKAHALPEAAAR